MSAPAPDTFLLRGLPEGDVEAAWRTESDEPAPERVRAVDDALKADVALRRLKSGEWLLYRGDFHNARQLLTALGRRLESARGKGRPTSALDAFRREREQKAREASVLGRLLVQLDAEGQAALRRAPDTRAAVEGAWGPSGGRVQVVALRTLLGAMSAAEWRRRGLEVPGLEGRLHPHYGVFSPTRSEYVDLVVQAPRPKGKRVFDVGTGTGVLALVLLQRGAASAVATDLDPRAVACARENAERLGLADRLRVEERALFPEGRADLVVCNPPWVPEPPRTRVDRAVFDPGGQVLQGFLTGLAAHLTPGGEGWLLLSDLGVLLGVRAPGALEEAFSAAGLAVAWTRATRPGHPRAADASDPLHAARAREVTTLYCLRPAA